MFFKIKLKKPKLDKKIRKKNNNLGGRCLKVCYVYKLVVVSADR